MTKKDSQRRPEAVSSRILSSTGRIGGASIVVALINLIRTKIVAELLGSAGIGLLGLLESISAVGSRIAGLGLQQGGVRGIALCHDQPRKLSSTRKSLFFLNIFLGLNAVVLFWVFRKPIAELVFRHSDFARDVGLLGLAVFALQMAGGQTTLLQGLRKIRALANLRIASAIVASLVGVVAIATLGQDGIIWAILLVPAAHVAVGIYFIRQIERPRGAISGPALYKEATYLLRFGLVFVAASAMVAMSNLLVRTMLLNYGGIGNVGQLHAVMAIAAQSIGFIIASMQADYYPRLTQSIARKRAVHVLANRQSEIGLRLVGPFIIAAAAVSETLTVLLYSEQFEIAGHLLGWWLVGEVLRIPAYACLYIFIARGQTGLFLLITLLGVVTYAGLALLLLEAGQSLSTLAIAHVAMSIAVTGVTSALLGLREGFRWARIVLRLTLILTVAVCGLQLLGLVSPLLAAIVGLTGGIIFAVTTWRVLVLRLGSDHRLSRPIKAIYRFAGWPLHT